MTIHMHALRLRSFQEFFAGPFPAVFQDFTRLTPTPTLSDFINSIAVIMLAMGGVQRPRTPFALMRHGMRQVPVWAHAGSKS